MSGSPLAARPSHDLRPRRPGALLAAAAGLALFAAPAASAQTPDDGLALGPWVFAPYLIASYEVNDNVLLTDEKVAQSDNVRNTALGVRSTLYFSNSELRLGYEGQRRVFETRGLDEILSHDLDATLDLRFGNGSRLQIADRYSRGNSDVQRIDEGEERTFDGERFDLNTWQLDFSRDVPRMRGFQLQLSGDRLRYRADDVPFFDFRGVGGVVEYREPVNPRLWLTVSYRGRRADHFDPQSGELLREERRDTLQVGIRGLDGSGQPYFVSVGAERFSYEGRNATRYSGLSVLGQYRLAVGRESGIRLTASRRALPSFFGTYYLVHDLHIGFDRPLFRRSRIGVSARFSENRYGDRVDLNGDGIEEIFRRKDSIRGAETFLEFRPSPRIGLRAALQHRKRESNYGIADYKNTVVSTSLLVGWPPR